ncbi:hypothetical protein PRIPAC_81021, partial [Pristionchus pacificus]|uniref:Ion channel n=1 Tax=Pristionchus pacificus TaxID=54126 RepID=A0A2A6CQU1_PRIPA
MLVHLFEIVHLIASISADTYVCNYDKKTVAGTMVHALEKCNLTYPADSQLIAVEPSRVAETILLKAYFDSQTWHAVPAAPAATYQLGSAMQFGCTIRCVKYIDGTGTLFPTRCNVVDMAAVCNEDQSLSLCTCSAGYIGSTCGVLIVMYEKIDQWLGPTETKKMLDIVNIAKTSPVALVTVLPSVYAMLPLDKKKEMSWTKDEVIDSAGFEMEDLNVESAITQVFDEQLGNCYTFNYANQTNSKQGLFTARVAGQSRGKNREGSSCKNCGSAVTGQHMAFPPPIRPSLKPTVSSTPSTLVFKSEPSQGLAARGQLLREDYLKIVVDKIGAANKSITQDYVQVERRNKKATLLRRVGIDLMNRPPTRMVESMMAASQEAQTNGADGDWLDRLGLDRQETIEKNEEYLEKLGKGVDIRWCSKHFNTGETLPIDLRLKPLLATTPLREELQSHRLNLRYRNHTMCSTPAVSEQVAWIETAAITTYIHAPGTPPKQGITYSVIAAESNLLALRKKITQLSYGCISSTKELKTNYYEDGEYTKEVTNSIIILFSEITDMGDSTTAQLQGCYFACYQDKVLEKCGCMDARLRRADTASQCLFKDSKGLLFRRTHKREHIVPILKKDEDNLLMRHFNLDDCVDSVTQQFGDVSSWQSCKCPSECYQEMYALTATRSGLPFKTASCANDTTGCPEVSTTIARLTIYIESLESEVYVEQEKLSLSSMLSNIGNQLGFLLGMSIVGIIEILILCAQLGKEQFTKK